MTEDTLTTEGPTRYSHTLLLGLAIGGLVCGLGALVWAFLLQNRMAEMDSQGAAGKHGAAAAAFGV